MLEDLTFELKDYVEMTVESATPASIVDRVLQRLRSAAKSGEGRTRSELNSDPICGGSVTGIKKALQRLESHGLVCSTEEPSTKRAGSSVKRYFALVSRDMCERECPPIPVSSAGLEKLGGQGLGVSPLISGETAAPDAPAEMAADLGGHQKPCPPETTSVDADSAKGDKFSVTPQEAERTAAEVDTLKQNASGRWS
jgi:hypothetical protein